MARWKKTKTGRVVYERPKKFFTYKSLERITRIIPTPGFWDIKEQISLVKSILNLVLRFAGMGYIIEEMDDVLDLLKQKLNLKLSQLETEERIHAG